MDIKQKNNENPNQNPFLVDQNKCDRYRLNPKNHIHYELELDRKTVLIQEAIIRSINTHNNLQISKKRRGLKYDNSNFIESIDGYIKIRLELLQQRVKLIEKSLTCSFYIRAVSKAFYELIELQKMGATGTMLDRLSKVIANISNKEINRREQTSIGVLKNAEVIESLGEELTDTSSRRTEDVHIKNIEPTQAEIMMAERNARKLYGKNNPGSGKVFSINVLAPKVYGGFADVVITYERMNEKGILSYWVDSVKVRFSELVEVSASRKKVTVVPSKIKKRRVRLI